MASNNLQFTAKSGEFISVTKLRTESGDRVVKISKDDLCIVWNTGKSANVYLDGEIIRLNKNCVLFVTLLKEFKVDAHSSFNIIHFNKASKVYLSHLLNSKIIDLLFLRLGAFPKLKMDADTAAYFTWTWQFFRKELIHLKPYHFEIIMGSLNLLLLCSARLYSSQNLSLNHKSKQFDVIKSFYHLLEQNYKSVTVVGKYAKMLNLTPKVLSDIFKKNMGESPKSAIDKRRYQQAVSLLTNSNITVSEISRELNFLDVYSFSRFFKSISGKSPSKFRETVLETK